MDAHGEGPICVTEYAIDDGEYRSDTHAIASPVFVLGDVPAALALSGVRRDGVAGLVDPLVERVVAAAAALSRPSGADPAGSTLRRWLPIPR